MSSPVAILQEGMSAPFTKDKPAGIYPMMLDAHSRPKTTMHGENLAVPPRTHCRQLEHLDGSSGIEYELLGRFTSL